MKAKCRGCREEKEIVIFGYCKECVDESKEE